MAALAHAGPPGLRQGALAGVAPGAAARSGPPSLETGTLGQATARLQAGAPAEAVALLDPYVRTVHGHLAASFHLRGAAHEALGRPDLAARDYRAAQYLAPEGEGPRAALARLGAPPHPGFGDLAGPQAAMTPAQRRCLSLLWIGAARAAHDVLGTGVSRLDRALRASTLGELGRFEEAEAELDRIGSEGEGWALVPYLRSTFAHWRGQGDAEERWLDEARLLAPGSVDVRAAVVARDAGAGRAAKVREFLTWEATRPGGEDPFRRITRAALYASLGEVEPSRAELETLARDYLESPQRLVVLAGLQLRQGLVEEGAASLERLVELAPGNVLLLPTANLLASVGRPQSARRAAGALGHPLRDDPRVLRILGMLASGQGGPRQSGVEDGLSWEATRDTPRAAIQAALALVKAGRDVVDARLGGRVEGPVAFTLVHTPGEPPWGYYDAVRRRVVYRGDLRPARWTPRDQRVLAHVARHEYAHLAFDARLRDPGDPLVTYPRWLMEGIADQLAGGLSYLDAFGYSTGSLDTAALDEAQLARVLAVPILGAGAIPEVDQARAYRQSYHMVGELLDRAARRGRAAAPAAPGPGAWREILALAAALGRGEDLGAELRARFGLGYRELVTRAVLAARREAQRKR